MKSADRRLLQMTLAAQKHKKAVEHMVRILRLFLETKNIFIGRSRGLLPFFHIPLFGERGKIRGYVTG